ncbi:MAG TPA: zf-HC2 domain-containing protein [Candidatus Binataceae bacterium]|nr:zf-HC2 domain-containing protein [Candidatus Binataceae bacterium]
MECQEYIDEYLAAHADDELSLDQRRAVSVHLAGCAICRARLIEERSLKALVRQNAGIVKVPADVRLRIRAALGNAAEAELAAPTGPARHPERADRNVAAGRRPRFARAAAQMRRPVLWAPLGLAVAILIIVAVSAGLGSRGTRAPGPATVPAFDTAIGKYLAYERNFVPNVPAEAFANDDGSVYAWVENRDSVQRVSTEASDVFNDVARSYREANMPDDIFNFAQAGYQISGGRIDHVADGSPVTYTLYAGDAGTILSICFRDSSMAAPIGAINWLGMRSFYAYKGYSICLSFYPTGHYVSILVSRMPADQMIRDVAMADVGVISH